MNALDEIRRACERLRGYPEARWLQPPRPPLGARAPLSAARLGGDALQHCVRREIHLLMQADAEARGVQMFTANVSVFALPDVLEALARSLAGVEDSHDLLRTVATNAREW